MAWKGIGIAVAVGLACLIFLGFATDFLVDWLWFSAIGYRNVFWMIFGAKAALFFVVLAASALFIWLNGFLAYQAAEREEYSRATISPWQTPGGQTLAEILVQLFQRFPWRSLIAGASIIVAALIALGETSNWDLALRFIYQTPYGQSDPLFGKDIGVYLFSLPAYVALKNWMLLIIVSGTLMAGAVYWAYGDLALDKHRPASPFVIAHGSSLLGLFFAVKAWSYWLDRFLLLYNDNGVVVGAAYTDVYVKLEVLSSLAGFALAAALASWANIWVRSYKLPVAAIILLFGGSFLAADAFPAVFQRFYVKPNELQLETPYLRHNIALTREAYNLSRDLGAGMFSFCGWERLGRQDEIGTPCGIAAAQKSPVDR